MKRILGLDLGTSSIGWALINESESPEEESSVVKLGVRVNPLSTDEKGNFEKGRPIGTNADRTLKRSARRNLQRYKLRRESLKEILRENNIMTADTPLTEVGKNTTHQTLSLRARAARERITLDELARVLLAINKKRGYKSSRKARNDDEGIAIDGMSIAKELYEKGLTPGAFVFEQLSLGKKYIPDFYQSDLRREFKKIWTFQAEFHPEDLSEFLLNDILGKNRNQTWAICKEHWNIEGKVVTGTARDKKLERYRLRKIALETKIDLEDLTIVLQEINADMSKSSGYLGKISDRSKKLFFRKITVGEYLFEQLLSNPHNSLKNQVFYRQDYLDEFEQIWETQSRYHKILNDRLKEEIRDTVIFYQRRLKSQKSLISLCEFESWKVKILNKDTGKSRYKLVGRRVIPKSSPLFQEFKIWQNLNNVKFSNHEEKQEIVFTNLDSEIRIAVFNELNLRGNLKSKSVLKIIGAHLEIGKLSNWKCNFDQIEGNKTNEALFNVYQTIAENEGYGFDWEQLAAAEIREELSSVFKDIGVNPLILNFDPLDSHLDGQLHYQLWHLLYSAEDESIVNTEDSLEFGNTSVALKKVLHSKFGFPKPYLTLLSNVVLVNDYGNLSAKAIKNIYPFLKGGMEYSEACEKAGYTHSGSFTRVDLTQKEYKSRLEILPKNSLRNPVVEKILNQMINLINQIIDTYGKIDEIRVELARELKRSAKERQEMTKGIAEATRKNEDIRKLLVSQFGILNPSKNDIIRYRLWDELSSRGYKDLFTDQQIKHEDLFSNKIDIEHIIPKALLFDDSFSNKTLAFKSVNLKKADRTAMDFIDEDHFSEVYNYKERVESLFINGGISAAKRKKLLMHQANLPDGFIERDLRNSQYISKKAREILLEIVPQVLVTTGSITDKLREDWDLINIMKELSIQKYKALGLVTEKERRNGNFVVEIQNWSKRNDHRHHAMDALTVAFTTHKHVQYLNFLNARRDENHKKHNVILGIEQQITHKDERGKRRFIPPITSFRTQAKDSLESVLVSFKTKNKVVTKNINRIRTKNGRTNNYQLTPRGMLHKETVYGKCKLPKTKATRINKKLTLEQVGLIVNKGVKKSLMEHLEKFQNAPEIAFDTKTLKKQPILHNGEPLTEVWCFEEVFTIRKDVAPDLKIEKVIDPKVRKILQDRKRHFNGNAKAAFSDLENNPIWLNESKGICIKRVKIKGVNVAQPLHLAHDHLGRIRLDDQLKYPIPKDFVSTGNNHHVAIYRDRQGKLQEKVMSLFEAVERVNQGLPVLDKIYNEGLGWRFEFSMKQNEMFLLPSDDFNPNEMDLMDPTIYKDISNNLFRVQKIATRNYVFRHHLETTVTNDLDFTFKQFSSTIHLEGIVKVRVNHIGQIVQIGEY